MGEKWEVKGHYLMACNCDFGCPCNFNARPTPGFCEGALVFVFSEGHYGNTDLGGTKIAALAKWPGAIHEGGGKGALYIDESAEEEQRQALLRILSGDEGGVLGMIMKNTLDSMNGPHYVPIDATLAGKDTAISIDGKAQIQFDSIKNPVTGNESFPRVVLPQGLWSDELEQFTTKSFEAGEGDLQMSYPGKVAQIAEIHWQGP